MDVPDEVQGGKRSREELEAAKEELIKRYPIEQLDSGARKVLFSMFDDPLDVWALYKYGGITEHKEGAPAPALPEGQKRRSTLREWADAHDVWRYMLERRFKWTVPVWQLFPNHRWFFFAWAFASKTESADFDFGDKLPTSGTLVKLQIRPGTLDMKTWVPQKAKKFDPYLTWSTKLCLRGLALALEFISTVAWKVQTFDAKTAFKRSLINDYIHLQARFEVPAPAGVALNGTLVAHTMRYMRIFALTAMMYAAFETEKLYLHVVRAGHNERINSALCGACAEAPVTRLCGQCGAVGYCSEMCADAHWKEGAHHAECKTCF